MDRVMTTEQRIAKMERAREMDVECFADKVQAMRDLRNALRIALVASNASETFAGQDFADETTIAEAGGVYGLVSRALEIMGEDPMQWAESGEWRD